MSRLDDRINDIRGELDGVIDSLQEGGADIEDVIGSIEVAKDLLNQLESEADEMEDEMNEDTINKDDVENWIDTAENNMSEIFSDLSSKVRWGY
jgi:chromosome segregation ATPase